VLAAVRALHPTVGVFATYSVTRALKQLLTDAGVPYLRLPGFGRKHQRLVAGAV
jgi:S-adenosyl-L-methionine-dependent methyltransferase